MTNKKPKLTEVGVDKKHEKADPGKFRAMVLIDSAIYIIENDQETKEKAFELCTYYRGKDDCFIQVFDDQGVPLVENGSLKN